MLIFSSAALLQGAGMILSAPASWKSEGEKHFYSKEEFGLWPIMASGSLTSPWVGQLPHTDLATSQIMRIWSLPKLLNSVVLLRQERRVGWREEEEAQNTINAEEKKEKKRNEEKASQEYIWAPCSYANADTYSYTHLPVSLSDKRGRVNKNHKQIKQNKEIKW